MSKIDEMIPQLQQGQTVKEWRRLFICATAHLADDKERLKYLPRGVQRNPADMQWAFEAAKCDTLDEALDELEKRLDGSKDMLTAVTDFYKLEPGQQPLSADGLSVFFFKVMDAGKTAGLGNEHIAFKFLEYAPGGKKTFRDLKSTIKATMTKDALLTLYDHSKEHAPTTREMKVKDEPVFVVKEEEKIPSWAKELQREVRSLKGMKKEIASTDETSVTSTDDNAFYSKDKKICSICKMTNHEEKDCFRRICKRCKGTGHDVENCPTPRRFFKKSKGRTSNKPSRA